MEVILDTNFIVSCIRKKIDFLDELADAGFKVLLPKEVFQELKDLKFNTNSADKEAVKIALQLFEKRRVSKMSLGGGNVDSGLIEMGKKGAYIATLDSAIKRVVPNKVVISESSKGIQIERA